jgi:aconitate hydratase
MGLDQLQAMDVLETKLGRFSIFRLDRLEKHGLTQLCHLPYSIRILLESVLRQCNGK